MKEGRGGGKEREAPTHLIKNSKLTHAARVTKYSKRMRFSLHEGVGFSIHSLNRTGSPCLLGCRP